MEVSVSEPCDVIGVVTVMDWVSCWKNMTAAVSVSVTVSAGWQKHDKA